MDNIELEQKITKYIQKESYAILASFHNVCEENDLRYILDYGTLLGAVRHQGFIPWDDDIDVSMPREDYDKFISIMQDKIMKGECDLFLQNNETDPHYYLPFSKLRLKNDRMRELSMSHFDIVHGPWIDVFVFDDMPLDEELFYKKVHKINKKRKFIDYITPVIYEPNAPNQHAFKTAIKRKVINLAKNKSQIFYRYLDTKYDSLSKAIKSAREEGQNMSEKMVSYAFPIRNETDLKINTIYRESFQNRKLVKFEKNEFYIPQSYDLILKSRYGDYNILPPKEERKSNHRWDLENIKQNND